MNQSPWPAASRGGGVKKQKTGRVTETTKNTKKMIDRNIKIDG